MRKNIHKQLKNFLNLTYGSIVFISKIIPDNNQTGKNVESTPQFGSKKIRYTTCLFTIKQEI